MMKYDIKLKDTLLSFNGKYKSIALATQKTAKNYDLYYSIINITQFLNHTNPTITDRIFYILNDLYEVKKCKCGCGQEIYNTNKNFISGHANRCTEVKDKKVKTYLEKYGVINPGQSKDIRNIVINTCISRYGVDNPMKVQSTKDKIINTTRLKYGVDNVYQNADIKLKIQQTNLNRYGVVSPLQNEQIKDKVKNTNLIKYGIESVGKSLIVRDKIKNTNNIKYGVDFPLQSQTIRDKSIETNMQKYGYKYACQSPDVKAKILKSRHDTIYKNFSKFSNIIIPLFDIDEFKGCSYDLKYKWKCVKCGNIFEYYFYSFIPRCEKCFPVTQSKQQLELYEFVKGFDPECKLNDRKILNGSELDIYSKKYNIAIEYNGFYWHSENTGTYKEYHLNKTNLCDALNIRLLHIFEDEWLNNRKMVENKLRYIFNTVHDSIYARDCEIKEIDSNLKSKFLNKYHLQGDDNSSIKLGAFYKNRLVSIMTFGHPRYDISYQYELIRFCSIFSYNIVGIAGKLYNHFVKNYTPTSIITYADRRWSTGQLYKTLGFDQIRISSPGYWYVKNHRRYHRSNFMKKNMPNMKDFKFDENLSEYMNMELNGFYKIWDCGNYVFGKIFNNIN